MNAPFEEPPHLRTLRRLVNILTVVFILGFLTIVAVIVMRFASLGTPAPQMPENIALPSGETAQAVTLGRGWMAVVSQNQDGQETIYIFNPDGSLRESVLIKARE